MLLKNHNVWVEILNLYIICLVLSRDFLIQWISSLYFKRTQQDDEKE